MAFLLLFSVLGSLRATAEVGIVVYESKGSDTRLSGAGHLALITTTLCPAGTTGLRKCYPGEEPGAVITHYPNIAAGYRSALFVMPIRAHFTATTAQEQVPLLTDGASLEAMQLEYWRHHLKTSLPPLTHEQYHELRRQEERFDAGRVFRRTVTMQYLFRLLGPHGKRPPTEPIAIRDPRTRQLIPEGRWRDAVGVQYVRSSVIITAHASPQQEERLLLSVDRERDHFNALTDNCSDFVGRSLEAVFGDTGFHVRPRIIDPANAWIRSPVVVTTSFLSFAETRKVPLRVKRMPMIAGTRQPSAPGGSIARGMLFPDARQGKLGFGMRVYINVLNPLLGLTALGVDEASRYADLQRFVHQRGSGELSAMANAVVRDPLLAQRYAPMIKREQIEAFGTSLCWEAEKRQFARIEQQAVEVGLLSRVENSLLLRQDQPYLLPRYYEKKSKLEGGDGTLMAGVQGCLGSSCGTGNVAMFLPAKLGPSTALPRYGGRHASGAVPTRSEIREMSTSGEPGMQAMAFRLMTAQINYALSSVPTERPSTDSFDADWRIYLQAAEANSLTLPQPDAGSETVRGCSVDGFLTGAAKTDAYEDATSFNARLVREGRGLLYAPTR